MQAVATKRKFLCFGLGPIKQILENFCHDSNVWYMGTLLECRLSLWRKFERLSRYGAGKKSLEKWLL